MWFQTPRPAVLSEGSWPAVVTASVPPLAYENLAGKDLITVFGLLQSVTVSCAFHVPSRPSPHVTSRPLAEPDSSDCAMAVELAANSTAASAISGTTVAVKLLLTVFMICPFCRPAYVRVRRLTMSMVAPVFVQSLCEIVTFSDSYLTGCYTDRPR